MIVQKLLETIKPLQDDEVKDYLDFSYSLFSKDLLDQNKMNKISTKLNVHILSSLVRFFRLITPTFSFDDDEIKEVFKNKNQALKFFQEKINEIRSIQNTRINFTDKISLLKTKSLVLSNVKEKGIKIFSNISWKVDLIISNKLCSKVLTPCISLFFHFSDGSVKSLKVSIKVFQEMRKTITHHIKKILDNEKVVFLK